MNLFSSLSPKKFILKMSLGHIQCILLHNEVPSAVWVLYGCYQVLTMPKATHISGDKAVYLGPLC